MTTSNDVNIGNRQTTGGIPALRGFRKQLLYTLRRIINSDTEVVYPENLEDLAVYDETDSLIEIVQVKDHKNPLTFSELDTFFQRTIQIVREHPNVRIILASYGELGPELNKNIGADKATLKKNKKFGTPDMLNVFQRLSFQPLQEKDELHSIKDFLTDHPMIVGEWQSAFDLLMQDLYRGAEESRAFTRQTVLEHLQHIGQYLVGRGAHQKEWGVTILPLENQEIEQVERLRKSFHEGIAASWEHISAKLDIVRDQHLKDIEDGFKNTNVVIVHGASGQGKSALAYRYLHDYCPCAARYEIRDLSTPKRALEVATALAGYGVQLTFYVDACHNDKGLPEFLRRIQTLQHIHCLVTIREEDWRLVNLTSADIQFTDLELGFNREEARKIYIAWEHGKGCRFPDFEQAWAKFTEAGPLLEFVYLLTHTTSLRDRLYKQYERIADGIDCQRRSEYDLKLVEYVAIAGACGARIDLSKLSGDAALKRSISRLEKEYLLRISNDKRYLVGLHPIRSTILSDILTDSVIYPWTALALECLPLLADADLEIFLLHSFISHPEASEALLTYLGDTKLSTWTAAGGVVRALLWKGAYDYVQKNRELIELVYDKAGEGWWMMLDFDLLGLLDVESTGSSILEILPEQGKKQILSWRVQQTPKAEVFVELENWLKKMAFPPMPSCEQVRNWQELGQVSYWIGFTNLEIDLCEYIDWTLLRHTVASVPLESLADVIYGLWHALSNKAPFAQWYGEIRPLLLDRYRTETRTPYIEEKDMVIRAHFIVPLEEDGNNRSENTKNEEGNRFHNMALQHVDLLAQLFPDCTRYGCQGYGHQFFDFDLPDDTTKTAIDAWRLTPTWVTQVNKTARVLGSHLFRPATWQDYCSEILNIRTNTVICLEELRKSLSNHFRSKKVVQHLSTLSEEPLWKQCSLQVANIPKLPLEALDRLGYTEEKQNNSPWREQFATQQGLIISVYLRRYQAYLQEKADFFCGLSNFINQAVDFLAAYSFLGKAKNVQKRLRIKQKIQDMKLNVDHPFISVHNLADAIKVLPKFQRLYRQHFARLSDPSQLLQLEQQEYQILRTVWCLWYYFTTKPSRHWIIPTKETSSHLERRMQAIRKNIGNALSRASTQELQFRSLGDNVFENEPALWIAVDGKNPVEVYSQIESLFKLLNKSLGGIKLHSIDNYAIEFQWRHVVVVPLCHGQLLENHAWVIPTYQFIADLNKNEELSKVNLVLRQILSSALSNLGLKIWRPELLNDARVFLQSVAILHFRLQHLTQVGEVPNLDEIGSDIVQSSFDELREGPNKDLQEIIDSMGVLASLYERQVAGEQQETSAVEYLHLALKQLNGISDKLLPGGLDSGQIVLTITALRKWQKQVSSVQGEVFVIYLLWCGFLTNSIYEVNHLSGTRGRP